MNVKSRFYIFFLSYMIAFLGLHFLGTFWFYLIPLASLTYALIGLLGGKKHV